MWGGGLAIELTLSQYGYGMNYTEYIKYNLLCQ